MEPALETELSIPVETFLLGFVSALMTEETGVLEKADD